LLPFSNGYFMFPSKNLKITENRLRLFENRVLRGIYGPKREEVKGNWGRVQNTVMMVKSGSM